MGARIRQLERLAERFSNICHLCKQKVPPQERSRSHLLPRSHGGSNARHNIALAHKKCNQRFGDNTLFVTNELLQLEESFKQYIIEISQKPPKVRAIKEGIIFEVRHPTIQNMNRYFRKERSIFSEQTRLSKAERIEFMRLIKKENPQES